MGWRFLVVDDDGQRKLTGCHVRTHHLETKGIAHFSGAINLGVSAVEKRQARAAYTTTITLAGQRQLL
jgi:hypothetical protein